MIPNSEIEYEGYTLKITKPIVHNAWFVGTSVIAEDWRLESASQEFIEKSFKEDVDEKIAQEDLIFCIESQQELVRMQQRVLEVFLRNKGYSFYTYTIPNSQEKYQYGVHPDYEEAFQKEKNGKFPNWAVVRI